MATVLEAKQKPPQATKLPSNSQNSMGHNREQILWCTMHPCCVMKSSWRALRPICTYTSQCPWWRPWDGRFLGAQRTSGPPTPEARISLSRLSSSRTSSEWETTALLDAPLSEGEKHWQINRQRSSVPSLLCWSKGWRCPDHSHTARQTLTLRAGEGVGNTTVYHVSPFITCLLESSLVPIQGVIRKQEQKK